MGGSEKLRCVGQGAFKHQDESQRWTEWPNKHQGLIRLATFSTKDFTQLGSPSALKVEYLISIRPTAQRQF